MGAARTNEVELARLAELEIVVSKGLGTFLEVGAALMEIRTRALYRWQYTSFEEYCRGRWGMSRSYAHRMIVAAEVAEDLSPIGNNNTPDCPVPSPGNEAQIRPLARLPREERADAWKEAVESAPEGQPTAKQVEQVVNRKLGKPEAPAKPAGQSKVNGVLRPDPPDIKEARAAGIIAPDVVPEIDEPEPAPEPAPDPGPAEAEPSDEEWLASLPGREKLPARCRKVFDADALEFRKLEPHRDTFRRHAARIVKGKGAFAFRVRQFLRTQHPRHWTACPAPEHGGCGGTGEVPVIGQCAKCYGRGYLVQ